MSAIRRARSRALAYVSRGGSALERARAATLAGAAPPHDAIARLEAAQREDGSFALSAAGALPDTLAALRALAELHALERPAVERACAWLARAQAEDGSWGAGAPEARDEERRIALTGALAGLLGRTRFASPAVLGRAAAYLGARWSPDRVRPAGASGWGVLAGYASFFANVPHELSDEGLQWCGRELERGFRSRRLDALGAARVFVDADAHALPGARIERAALVEALLAEQHPEGGFGDRARTLDALAALAWLA